MIDEYTKCTIIDMTNKVLEHIAKKHEKVKEGVKSVMGGKILEYEAKKIRNEGISQGISQGKFDAYIELIQDGLITIAEAAKRLCVTEKELENRMKSL